MSRLVFQSLRIRLGGSTVEIEACKGDRGYFVSAAIDGDLFIREVPCEESALVAFGLQVFATSNLIGSRVRERPQSLRRPFLGREEPWRGRMDQ